MGGIVKKTMKIKSAVVEGGGELMEKRNSGGKWTEG